MSVKNIENREHSVPVPCEIGRDAIDKLSELLSRKLNFNYRESSLNSIIKVVEYLGGEVKRLGVNELIDNDEKIHGSLEVINEKEFYITIPDFVSSTRNRFTIAHELGHYFLHYIFNEEMKGKVMVAQRSGSSDVEVEANAFAAAFLMPKKAVEDEFSSHKSASWVSFVFNTSLEAAEYRLKYLSL